MRSMADGEINNCQAIANLLVRSRRKGNQARFGCRRQYDVVLFGLCTLTSLALIILGTFNHNTTFRHPLVPAYMTLTGAILTTALPSLIVLQMVIKCSKYGSIIGVSLVVIVVIAITAWNVPGCYWVMTELDEYGDISNVAIHFIIVFLLQVLCWIVIFIFYLGKPLVNSKNGMRRGVFN